MFLFKENLMAFTTRDLWFLFFLLMFGFSSYAQQSAPALRNNQLKFSPIKLIDPINPGLELSYERRYAKQFSTQLSVAYLKDFFNTTP
ncbi:MAG: hypothetical protein JWO58_678 [Chitinophagaceae bacterium]|nr:hypothetical protein [Chitinophagaceae bacterium]